MHILVSNDDGYLSQGIAALAAAMRELGSVTVVAPERDRSGASNSLTLSHPLRPWQPEEGTWTLDGTPTDCVHIALTGLIKVRPDVVVSGINHGANMGDDVFYSGTVAAAMEGRFLGLPAVAVSMAAHEPAHLQTAARATAEIVARLASHPLPPNTMLNVNVPDLPWAMVRGYRATRLGRRHPASPVVPALDPRQRPVYWIGMAGPAQDDEAGTDFHAVAAGYISVTPLELDLTCRRVVEQVQDWLPVTQAEA